MPVWDPKANDLLSQALDCASAEDRGLFLDQACGADTELRARVEKMLAAQAKAGSFLESPAADLAATTAHRPLAERPGTVIGAYKLLQQIGEGGMGIVFMAEQTEPIQRTVALKIIKPGMDTRQVIARFEVERQAVAMMDHPNIAKVLDAGTTDSGRPYFVMELVKGVPITKYCDDKHLPIRDRLELFIEVCQAVQHAHQKGIIHRDIKPNNVLVAEYDNHAVPKVIDFGVAKATAQKLTERTMFTEFGQVLGTMEYMSPEQSKFNQLDVDTRSDIYSLGVMLYELLAGSTPFGGKRLHEAAFDEMLRIIREEEPPKPSTRVSSIDTLPSIAANRQTEPARLSKQVRGELDWIVMKALEKDRGRRYETANGFAMDVQRYLADEPVQAGPPSATYRFRKFARRNKAALLTVMALMVALVGGTTVSTWEAIRATRATRAEQEALIVAKANEQAATESAKRADAERVRAEAISWNGRRAVNNVVINAAMGLGKWTDMPTQYRKIIAADALKYYESLIQTNNADPAVRYETGIALGNVGLMHWQFGENDEAAKLYRRSADVMDALVRDVPKPAEYRQQCAFNHLQLGGPLVNLGRLNEAEKEFRIAISLYEQLLSESPGRLNLTTELCECYFRLIWAIAPAPEAQTLYRKMVVRADAASQPFFAQNHPTTRPADQAHREAGALGEITSYLADAPAYVGRDHQLVIRIGRAMSEVDPGSSSGWATLAVGQYLAGDYNAARAAFSKAAELKSKLDLHEQLFFAMTLWQQGKKQEALRYYLAADKQHIPAGALQAFIDAQDLFDKSVADEPDSALNWHCAADARLRIGQLMINHGHYTEAEQLLRQSIEMHEKRVAKFAGWREGSSDEERAESYDALAGLLVSSPLSTQRNPVLAIDLENKAVAIQPATGNYWNTLGVAQDYAGQWKDSIDSLKKAVELDSKNPRMASNLARFLASSPDLHDAKYALKLAKDSIEQRPGDGVSWNSLGMVYFRAGQWKDAIEALKKSDELLEGERFSSNAFFMAMAYWRLDEKEESRKWYDRAVAWMDKNKPEDKRLKRSRAEAMELLGAGEKKDKPHDREGPRIPQSSHAPGHS